MLLNRMLNHFLNNGWSKLPLFLGLLCLVLDRKKLYKNNLYSSYVDEPDCKLPKNTKLYRTSSGIGNDLSCPMMGSVGTRFGRNFSIDKLVSLDSRKLLDPNPREISEKLLARKKFIPATSINLLAAAWVQFMVHDWFAFHETSKKKDYEIPLNKNDGFPENPMTIDSTVASKCQDNPDFISYDNQNSHWWDGTQIYGRDNEALKKLRVFKDGKLKIKKNGFLYIDSLTGLDLTGLSDNWWPGLSMLHIIFVKEHNSICDMLKGKYVEFSDEELFRKARLINTAMMAKIHTVEWTPAILDHPTVKYGMDFNWNGFLGKSIKQKIKFRNQYMTGILGSKFNHFGVPFSITEEFISCYRMHSLLPDNLNIYSHKSGELLEEKDFFETLAKKSRGYMEKHKLEDLLYSFGTSYPGALCLNNYPNYLRNLNRQDDGKLIDLATIDIFRDRERQIPRYNEFRRLLSLSPAKSFDDLAQDKKTANLLKSVYNSIEDVDFMVGCLSEEKPKGFGFSGTQFHIFILMASRRLSSDRFFCQDYKEEVYTKEGIEWIEKGGMTDVCLRHFPELQSTLEGLSNAFAPWDKVK